MVNVRVTYRRGFFLGPGFPLGFAFGPASACAAVRFVPGLGPGTPFLLPLVAGGGARELLSVAVASVPGTGVPLVSEASGAGALMRGVEAGAGEAVGDGSETSSDSGLNFFNRWGAIRRTTSLFGLTDDLAEAFCEGVVAIVDGRQVGGSGKLEATTWIAPVVGGVALSRWICGVDYSQALRNVGRFWILRVVYQEIGRW